MSALLVQRVVINIEECFKRNELRLLERKQMAVAKITEINLLILLDSEAFVIFRYPFVEPRWNA
jgi:hypothetical protein